MSAHTSLAATLEDFAESGRRRAVWATLAWIDVRQKYRRAFIGPFWITISMALMLTVMAFVYGALLKVELASYLPYLAGGLIAWYLISTVINEGMNAFSVAEGLIKHGGLPLSMHVFRVVWRNVIVFAHNVVVMIGVYIAFGFFPYASLPAFLLGLALTLLNLTWMLFIIAPFCTRFRDLPPIFANAVQISFFITPVLFNREQLPSHYRWVVDLNPFSYMIEVIRAPLIGQPAPLTSLLVSLGLCIVGWVAAVLFFARVRSRLAFWL